MCRSSGEEKSSGFGPAPFLKSSGASLSRLITPFSAAALAGLSKRICTPCGCCMRSGRVFSRSKRLRCALILRLLACFTLSRTASTGTEHCVATRMAYTSRETLSGRVAIIPAASRR